jgi:hypothetical protein
VKEFVGERCGHLDTRRVSNIEHPTSNGEGNVAVEKLGISDQRANKLQQGVSREKLTR